MRFSGYLPDFVVEIQFFKKKLRHCWIALWESISGLICYQQCLKKLITMHWTVPTLHYSVGKTHKIPLQFYFTFSWFLARLNIFSFAFFSLFIACLYCLPNFLLHFRVYILLIFEKSWYICTSIVWLFFPALLRYNWHTASCKFKLHMLTWYTYTPI